MNSRRRDLIDGAILLTLSAVAVVETTANESVRDSWAVTTGAALMVLGCAALRSRAPWAAALTAGALLPVQALLGGRAHVEVFATVVAALLLVFAVAARYDRRGAITGGGALLLGLLLAIGVEGDVFDAMLAAIVLGASWVAGRVVHRLHGQTAELAALAVDLAAERDRSAHEAALSERARIARDLHDVVAHHVSVMVVQAGGARGVLRGDLAAAERALLVIEETGRAALVEMRRLLGLLRSEGAGREPQPALGDVKALLGPHERLVVTGSPVAVEPGLDLTAYRVVQEALTKARRHGTSPARVVVTWTTDRLEVVVDNDGPVSAATGGHGLAGMRERVQLYDGTVQAGPVADGWRVHVVLPLATAPVPA